MLAFEDTNERACQASRNGDEAILMEMMARGNFEIDYKEVQFPHYTPLLNACSGGNAGCAALLISGRADVNVTNDLGRTPLMVAADSRHYGYDPTDLLQSLLHSGADLTKKDKQGWSAIDHAMSDANRNDSSSIAVKLLVSQSPLGQQLLDLLQQHSFDRFTEAVLESIDPTCSC